MSFHLPHRGLPQELRDMIYQDALGPPEGLTIQTEVDQRDLKEPPDPQFKCQQPIASGLLRTGRQVYAAALPVLYSRNAFTMNLSCFEVLKFLLSLPKQTGLLIQSLNLPSRLMFEDDYRYLEHVAELCEFLVNDMHLQDITLAVPDDFSATTNEKTGQYCWFMLALHDASIKAFVGGHFHEIRFAHPEMHAIALSGYEFHNLRSFINATVMEAYLEPLDEWRTALWNSYHNTQLNDIAAEIRFVSCNIVYGFMLAIVLDPTRIVQARKVPSWLSGGYQHCKSGMMTEMDPTREERSRRLRKTRRREEKSARVRH